MHSKFVNEKISSHHLNKKSMEQTNDSADDTVKDDDFDFEQDTPNMSLIED